jgi:hypothetical protein
MFLKLEKLDDFIEFFLNARVSKEDGIEIDIVKRIVLGSLSYEPYYDYEPYMVIHISHTFKDDRRFRSLEQTLWFSENLEFENKV